MGPALACFSAAEWAPGRQPALSPWGHVVVECLLTELTWTQMSAQPSPALILTMRADVRGGWRGLPTTGGALGATGWPGWQDTKRVAGHLGQEQGYEPSP